MNFKLIFKTVLFLIILLVVLYIGMNNTQDIDLLFPIATKTKISAPAALIYFGVFAIGVFAGAVLTAGGSKKSGGSAKPKA